MRRAFAVRFAQGGHLLRRLCMAHPGHYGSWMQLSPQEQRVVDAVADRREALVTLTGELVAFDTVTHTAGAPPREERALQDHVAALLRAHGAEVELHEPDAAALRPHPMVPEGLTFDGPSAARRDASAAAAAGARCC